MIVGSGFTLKNIAAGALGTVAGAGAGAVGAAIQYIPYANAIGTVIKYGAIATPAYLVGEYRYEAFKQPSSKYIKESYVIEETINGANVTSKYILGPKNYTPAGPAIPLPKEEKKESPPTVDSSKHNEAPPASYPAGDENQILQGASLNIPVTINSAPINITAPASQPPTPEPKSTGLFAVTAILSVVLLGILVVKQ